MPEVLVENFSNLGGGGLPILVAFMVLGSVMGSFASALIHRIPTATPVFALNERSACPQCGHTLKARDLIPLLSWLLTRGRCRYCGAAVPAVYPFLELVAAGMAGAVFLFYPAGDLAEKFIVLTTLPFLLALLVIDMRHKRLPNILVAILFALGGINLVYMLYRHPEDMQALFTTYLGGAVVYMAVAWGLSAIMAGILKKPALGMGDVKFFAVAGIWLGLAKLGAFCVLSGAFGVLYGLLWQKIKNEPLFPFGPALIVSFFMLLLMNGSLLF